MWWYGEYKRQEERRRQTIVWAAGCSNGDTNLRINKCHMFCSHQQLLQSKGSKRAFLESIQMFSQKLLHWQLTTFMQCWPNIWCGKSINCNPENYPWWAENHLEVILNGASSTPVTHHRLVGGTNLFFRLYLVVNSLKCKKKSHTFESWNVSVFPFETRFMCQHIDLSRGVTAVIRGDTFLVDYLLVFYNRL